MKVVSIFLRLAPVMAILILSGCGSFWAGFHKGPVDQESIQQAETLLNILSEQTAPDTFKGIGKISIEKEDQIQFARMAWVGSRPDKLRIQMLGLAGQSMASLSSDGKNFYIRDHEQQRFYQQNLSGASLKRLLSIPITPKEIVAILAGQVPIIDFTFATVDSKIISNPVLILETSFWGDYEKIYFDNSLQNVYAAEIYSNGGKLKYRVVFEQMGLLKDYQVPERIVLTNGCNTKIALDVNRYWVDIDIIPSAFVLTSPDTKSTDADIR